MFKINDRVTAYGLKGKVLFDNDTQYEGFPVVCIFEGDVLEWFTAEGKIDARHKLPVLKHIIPPKTIKDKRLFLAVKSIPDKDSLRGFHHTSYAYPNKFDVEGMFLDDHQICEVTIKVEE